MPPPDPSTLVAAGGEYASFGRRLLSLVIDQFAVSFLATPFIIGTIKDPVAFLNGTAEITSGQFSRLVIVTLLVQVAYMTVMHAWRGSSLGKMAARTVVIMEDGSAVTPGAAFVRAVTFAGIYMVSLFLVLPMVFNELRVIWSPRRQTWHDQVAHTLVVRA